MPFKFFNNAMRLTSDDLQAPVRYLIKEFLVEEAITMWYSESNQGKTWFTLSVAQYLLDNTMPKDIFYMDMDNGRSNIKERKIEHLLDGYHNFNLIHRSTIEVEPFELLENIGKEAVGSNYKHCFFFFDAVRDFVDGDMNNGNKVRRMLTIFKNIREAGGTVILIHHTTKNGSAMDGSSEFKNGIDNLYKLSLSQSYNDTMHFSLEVEKERHTIKDNGFTVNVKTLALKELDPDIASMSKKDEEFVELIKDVLKKNPNGIGQSQLLMNAGFSKGDRAANTMLQQFIGKLWDFEEGANKSKTYKLL